MSESLFSAMSHNFAHVSCEYQLYQASTDGGTLEAQNCKRNWRLLIEFV
jgi:hypothetical protein